MNNTTDRLGKLKEVLRHEGLCGWQVFDCRGNAGDHTETVYDKDGIQVEVCPYYEYVEILGLSKEEFNSLIHKDGRFCHLKECL